MGVTDNFFDLGGHSLLAMQIISRVRETLRVNVPLRAVFEAPTVEALAARVGEALRAERGTAPGPSIRPVPRGGNLPLSHAQRRLWFLHLLEPESASYNLHAPVRLHGPLDIGILRRCLEEMTRRHETLRTTFADVDGQAVQVVAPATRVELPVEDLSVLPEPERERVVLQRASEEAHRPFDLARGPAHARNGPAARGLDHVVLLTMHHIISDGWSTGVFIREIGLLYDAYARGGNPRCRSLPFNTRTTPRGSASG